MNVTSTIITCMCAILVTINIPPAEGWRGIVPLHSTRIDVERLLGSPSKARGVASTYETEDEKVLVFYSAEPCGKGNEWNVPRDTVISFTVSPNAKLLVANFKLDDTKYKRVRDFHIQGVVHYFNREDGIRISAALLKEGGEDITSITYESAAKDNHLRCPGAPAISDVDVDAPPPHLFDEYSNILLSDENARLGNFASYLQEESKLMGYIIAYAGRRARAGEAKARAERAKNYLVNERGIEAGRIVTIDGGHREHSMVELYGALRGGTAPAPTPTVEPSEVQVIKIGGARNGRPSTRLRCKR
jgi:hypothetical protein